EARTHGRARGREYVQRRTLRKARAGYRPHPPPHLPSGLPAATGRNRDDLRARHRAMALVSLDGADAATHDQAHAGRPPDTRRGRQGRWSARGRLAGRASDAVGAAGGIAPEERLPVGTTRAGRNTHAVGRREELDGDGGRRRSTRPALTAVRMGAYRTQQRRIEVGPEPPARQPRALGGHSRSCTVRL